MPKKGKTEIIRQYLAQNGTHTWKDAQATLEKKGITANYFSMVKSKMNGSRPAKKKSSDVVEFARACGGIDNAIAKLEELKTMQV